MKYDEFTRFAQAFLNERFTERITLKDVQTTVNDCRRGEYSESYSTRLYENGPAWCYLQELIGINRIGTDDERRSGYIIPTYL